jgi:hypothetical protein
MPEGVKTVLILPTPDFDTQPELCEPQWFRNHLPKTCSKVNPYSEMLSIEPLKQMHHDMLFFNSSNAVCPDKNCTMINNKQVRVFIDKDHLTDYSNTQYIYPALIEFSRKNQLLENPIATE